MEGRDTKIKKQKNNLRNSKRVRPEYTPMREITESESGE